MNTQPVAHDQMSTSAAPFILASLLTSYPDQHWPEGVRIMLADAEAPARFGNLDAWAPLRENLEVLTCETDVLDNLRSEYIDIFDRGRVANPLYETEYGRARALVKSSELADIAGFYRAFGFELSDNPEAHDMLDHVAIELEFYALMLMKHAALSRDGDGEGAEIVLDGMKKFLTAHLGRFVGSILERPGVVASDHYSKVYECVAALVAGECERLGIKPEPASWLDGQGAEGEISCGSAGSCLSGNPGAGSCQPG